MSAIRRRLFMADVYATLNSELADFEEEMIELEQKIAEFNARRSDVHAAISGIRAFLKAKGRSPVAATAELEMTSNGKSLIATLREALMDRKPHSLLDLAKAAEAKGFDFGEKRPLRTVNATLLGGGKAVGIGRLPDGRWQLTA
jgi:hypothetical protein